MSTNAQVDDEVALVEAAKQGSTAAFGTLVRRVRPKLFSVACRNVDGGAEVADDVVQDALVVAWRKIDRFDPREGAFSTWVCGIIKRGAKAASRRGARYVGDDAALDEADGGGSPEALVLIAERRENEEKARHERGAVAALLRHLADDVGLSAAAIARATGLSEAKVAAELKKTKDLSEESLP